MMFLCERGSAGVEAICRNMEIVRGWHSSAQAQSSSDQANCSDWNIENDFRLSSHPQVHLYGFRAVVLASTPWNWSIISRANRNRIAGFACNIADPEWFVAEQIAFSPPEKLSKNAIVVALQLGNIYLLMAMVGLIRCVGFDQPAYQLVDWHCCVVYHHRT